MADHDSQSPQDADSQGLGPDDKPRLTEEEKKQNHIASEQKRREAIRAGFDRLCDLVPGLAGQGRSEGHVLKSTVTFIREQLIRRRELVQALEAKGGAVTAEMREAIIILERLEERDRQRALDGNDNSKDTPDLNEDDS